MVSSNLAYQRFPTSVHCECTVLAYGSVRRSFSIWGMSSRIFLFTRWRCKFFKNTVNILTKSEETTAVKVHSLLVLQSHVRWCISFREYFFCYSEPFLSIKIIVQFVLFLSSALKLTVIKRIHGIWDLKKFTVNNKSLFLMLRKLFRVTRVFKILKRLNIWRPLHYCYNCSTIILLFLCCYTTSNGERIHMYT